MKTARAQPAARPAPARLPGHRPAPAAALAKLRIRLAETESTLRAIRNGDVDVVVVTAKKGVQLFTLEGAERAYRVLIESMNEGALMLTADKTILYANQCFAGIIKCPLEQVIGSSLRRFLSATDRALLRPLMKRTGPSGSKLQVLLKAGDGTLIPVQISLRRLARHGRNHAAIGMVVTDMTEARRTEELLRALTNRVVQVQEAERERLALELHDHITQLLCALLFRSQALADNLPARDQAAKQEARQLRKLLGQAAEEVERISRDLRPGVLDQLGLEDALRATSTAFAERTGLAVKVACAELTAPPSAATALTFYRILQEALKNVEQHARARHVAVVLSQPGPCLQLVINDDGIGFDAAHHAARRKGKGVLGLLSMQERAAAAGGTLTVKSGPRVGTEIAVSLPLPPAPATVR